MLGSVTTVVKGNVNNKYGIVQRVASLSDTIYWFGQKRLTTTCTLSERASTLSFALFACISEEPAAALILLIVPLHERSATVLFCFDCGLTSR